MGSWGLLGFYGGGGGGHTLPKQAVAKASEEALRSKSEADEASHVEGSGFREFGVSGLGSLGV